MPLSKAELTAGNSLVLSEHARRLPAYGMIAEQVFPRLLKPGMEQGSLRVYDKSNLWVPDDHGRPVGGPARRVDDHELTYVDWTAIVYALDIVATQRELDIWVQNGNLADELLTGKIRKIVDKMNLGREKNLADKLQATGNYESGYSTTLDAGVVWTNTSASDPITDITTAVNAIENGGVPATHFVCDLAVWRALERHPQLLDILKYTKGSMVDAAGFQTLFGLIPIVARCRYAIGETMYPVWGDGAIVCHINPNANVMAPEDTLTFGRTIVCSDFDVKEYEDETLDHNRALVEEVQFGYSHVFVGVDNATDGDSICGYLIDNAI